MKEALEKILKNFVFGGVKISYYDITEYPTPEMNKKSYEVEIYVPSGTMLGEMENLGDRLESAFHMLGFKQVNWNMYYSGDKDKL